VWLFGGAAGLLATWNWYRSLEGRPNWMTDVKVNLLDRATYAIAAIGIIVMIAGAVASRWLPMTSVWALEIIGCMLLVPAAICIAARALMRRAARQETEQRAES
jgi:uncharacterized membrane protein HdeD (DUF308 family)